MLRLLHRSRAIPQLLAATLLCGAPRASAVVPGPDPAPASAPGAPISLAVTAEGWRAVAGGVSAGSWVNSLADLRAELPATAVAGLRHGVLVVQLHWVVNHGTGDAFSDRTGSFSPVSGIMAEDQVRVFNLHFRHTAPDDHWACKVGQIAIDDDFMVPALASRFLNAGFGAMPSQVATPLATATGPALAYPIYGVAAPGAWFRWHPRPNQAWQTGVYRGAPGEDRPDNHGFDWTAHGSHGAAIFSEYECRGPSGVDAPSWRFGVAAHTGSLADYHPAGDPPSQRRGLWSAYLVHERPLLISTAGETVVAGFARLGGSPQRDRGVVAGYSDAGVVWFGPLGAPRSVFAGIGGSATRFQPAAAERFGRARTEGAVEVTSGLQLGRLAVQFDAQALLRPSEPNAGRRPTALVCGIRTTLTF